MSAEGRSDQGHRFESTENHRKTCSAKFGILSPRITWIKKQRIQALCFPIRVIRVIRGDKPSRHRVVDDLAVDNSHYGAHLLDIRIRNHEVIAIEHTEVGKFTGLDRADL